jgi:hypothetical protein
VDPSLLLLGSFGVLALMFGLTLFTVFREKRALSRLVQSAVDFDAVKDAITHLPAPHQEIAEQMIESINVRSTLDEALTKAVVRATNQSFEPPLARRLITNVAGAVILFGPLSLALVQAADGIVRTFSDAQARPSAVVYIRGQAQLEGPFETLHGVFSLAAWLVAGLAIAWALHWWLLRPEIREARFVRALLEAATRLRPGTAAPVSARLSELIAPDRGLGRPITAAVMWFVAVSLGWMILWGTAPVRAANTSEAVFDVWPDTESIGASNLVLPSARAGQPLDGESRPTIQIDADAVRVSELTYAYLDGGTLPPDWKAKARDLGGTLGEYKELELRLLAHRGTLMETVYPVLHELGNRYGAKRFHLIIARNVKLAGETKPKKVDADLPVWIGHEAPPSLQIVLEKHAVSIVQTNFKANLSDPAWPKKLNEAVRNRTELFEQQDTRATVELRFDLSTSYDEFIQVVGAADTSCRGEQDCGLPGLGLQFVLNPLSK